MSLRSSSGPILGDVTVKPIHGFKKGFTSLKISMDGSPENYRKLATLKRIDSFLGLLSLTQVKNQVNFGVVHLITSSIHLWIFTEKQLPGWC